jgi:hypothetical protein
MVEATGIELFRVLITRNLLILGTATTAKKAPLPDPLYVYCLKMFFAPESNRHHMATIVAEAGTARLGGRVCELGPHALRTGRRFRALLQDSSNPLPRPDWAAWRRRRPDHPDREGRIRLPGGTKNAYSGRAF